MRRILVILSAVLMLVLSPCSSAQADMTDKELREVTGGFSDLYFSYLLASGAYYPFDAKIKHLIAILSKNGAYCQWEEINPNMGVLYISATDPVTKEYQEDRLVFVKASSERAKVL